MKDILPLAATQGSAGRELNAAAGIKAGVKTGQTATDSASSVDSTADKASFLDSLQHVLSSSSTQDAAPALVSTGGKDLPLAEQTAASIPPGLMTTPTDMHAQQDTALLSGAPQGAVTQAMESADAASTTAALSVLSAQSKLPAQAGPVPADVSVDDIALQISDRDRVSASANTSARDMDLPLTLQAQQALNKADAFISSSSPLVRMQLASPDSSQQLNSIDKELAVKAGLMPQSNTRETAEPQLILKAGSVLAEPEPLITTRMQLSGLNQAGELPGHKLTLESMLTQTQPVATDSLNASLSRSPLLQTALSAELLTTTTSSQPVISETFGRADWGQGMGKQILWMVNQNISSAEFRLNPANLGPLEVRIDMDNDQVNVAFSSRHADVRDAVEQALPKLREMFEDKGLNLSDADVSQHSFAEQRENAFEQGEASGLSFTAENDDMAEQGHQGMDAIGSSSLLNEGLVDYYI